MRVIIMGSPAVGKTCAARLVSHTFGLAHLELDQVLWRPGWRQAPASDVEAALEELRTKRQWVLDVDLVGLGLIDVCPPADVGFWLDFSRATATRRVVQRSLRCVTHGEERWAGCPEHLGHLIGRHSVIRAVWTGHADARQRYVASYLRGTLPIDALYRLRSDDELSRAIANIHQRHGGFRSWALER